MTETPAKGQKGFLLYNTFDKKYFFRVYEGEGKFTDYDLCADDIEIEILDQFTTLYQGETRNTLNYSRKVLGRPEIKDS